MVFRTLDIGEDPRDASGDGGSKYYRIATITWSSPRMWDPKEDFDVPAGWAGTGGVYAFLRVHWRQTEFRKIAYVGKANDFKKRLTKKHSHIDIVRRRGVTSVSCGRIAFSRIRSRTAYYLEIEDIIKFAVWKDLENTQGFESLPGFRRNQPRVMAPWHIENKRYRFEGIMPRRIVYPTISVEK